MSRPGLVLALLLAVCVSAATWLGPRLEATAVNTSSEGGMLEALMGESRRLFAAHLIIKADVYFHGGFYPSIFDDAKGFEEPHLAQAGLGHEDHEPDHRHDHADGHDHDHDHAHAHGHDHAHDHAPSPSLPSSDWIDRFARNFVPADHIHLDSPEHGGDTREILPWLRLAAEMDPNRPEIYTLAAFWLRTQLGRHAEAEQFLREGLRANPGNAAIVFELGRIAADTHQDKAKARNLWELALRRWAEQEAGKPEPDHLLLGQITVHLAKLEDEAADYDAAIHYWTLARKVSPRPEAVDDRIAEITAKKAGAKTSVQP